MKNRFIVIFAILFAVLIVTPLLVFHTNDGDCCNDTGIFT